MDPKQIRDYLAALPPEEFDSLAAEARATPSTADQLRAAEQAGDWDTAFRIKAEHLGRLMNPKD